ncbi:hypothetical protein M1555_02975, partial [Patescibacteria group bacterium]|nr:hypothetical protein [Patescibacteria group bacterium]
SGTAEAATFVAEADRYNIDWRLVAAISGVESTFGRHIPEGSYNGWGWGIPTGASSGIAFSSWENGIHTVSQGLAENYFGRGARTLDDVGRIYAASPAWAWKVRFFIEKITDFSVTDPEAIPLSL